MPSEVPRSGQEKSLRTENRPVTASHVGFSERIFQSDWGVTQPASISLLNRVPEIV